MIELLDLFCVHFTDGSAHNRRVLAVHINESAIDRAITGNNTICRGFLRLHVVISASGSNISTNFNKAVVIKQIMNSVDCRRFCHFAFLHYSLN